MYFFYFIDLHFYGSEQCVTQNQLEKESCIQSKTYLYIKIIIIREKKLKPCRLLLLKYQLDRFFLITNCYRKIFFIL